MSTFSEPKLYETAICDDNWKDALKTEWMVWLKPILGVLFLYLHIRNPLDASECSNYGANPSNTPMQPPQQTLLNNIRCQLHELVFIICIDQAIQDKFN